MAIGTVKGLLLERTRKLPQLQALGMEHVAAPRHHLAIKVCDDRPRTDGASCLLEKQIHLVDKILHLLHGYLDACAQNGGQLYIELIGRWLSYCVANQEYHGWPTLFKCV